MNVGLALYTLRDEMEKDFKGTLEKVKQVGYQGVEFAGFGDHSSKEVKAMLEEIGLEPWSSHVPLEKLRHDLQSVIAFHKEVGTPYIVCPYLTEEERQTKTNYFDLAEELEEIGNQVREAGMVLLYHNHDFEFDTFDDEFGLDILLRNTRTCNMALECDTFWVEYAGHKATEYLAAHENRVPIIHVKDMKDGNIPFAEVGEGKLDIKGIIEAAKAVGTKYFIVEQDVSERSPLESIEISFKNIQSM
ncbi:sugar phosphate isomerase/epimerase family protein [Shouchella hunanensis]|uniref:Sugar phosphate isomerase/epimerase n=1 Tax=Shouchella hunanensis TaxID=766894 RepID=A0ABY7W9T5_9BACI|nr:sugar phosphate isomerase/epimerase [Shouchella hunanensis]WDF04600.1 sugar phosphate isomerase/epimerase [Shouchella hunanensis]